MSDDVRSKIARVQRSTLLATIGPLAFAAGGVAAAFGVASCCALPMLLGAIGLGGLASALFLPVFLRFQNYLAVAALVCIVTGGVLLWRRRSCVWRRARIATVLGLTIGAGLLVLGVIYGSTMLSM